MPALAEARSRARIRAAGREVASLFRQCRSQAISRGRSVAVRFERQGSGYIFALHEDSDGDGIQMADITSGRDRMIRGPGRLGDTAPGVEFSILQRPSVRKIPPQTGNLTNTGDPIQFGPLDLVSFTPLGSVTAGTAYLSDGDHSMAAVVVYGPTGRTRLWRYIDDQDRWVQ